MDKNIKRNKDTGNALERYCKSFGHAVDGIVYATKKEHNMIIILICSFVVIILGALLKISVYEWLFCLFIIGMIMATEMINTAIEATIDLITTNIHPLAKIAKDSASSATLIFCTVALIGGIVIFIPKILDIIFL